MPAVLEGFELGEADADTVRTCWPVGEAAAREVRLWNHFPQLATDVQS